MNNPKRKPNLKKAILQDRLLAGISQISGVTGFVTDVTVISLLSNQPIDEYFLHFSGTMESLISYVQNEYDVRLVENISAELARIELIHDNLSKTLYLNHYNTIKECSSTVHGFSAKCGIPLLLISVSVSAKNLGKIYDEAGGCQDFYDRRIRLSESREKTLESDADMLLKLCYCAARFGLVIDDALHSEMICLVEHLKDFPVERAAKIFFKILEAPQPSIGLILLHETGLLKHFLPEASNMAGVEPVKGFQHKDVFYHTCEVVDNISRVTDNVWLRFAAFVHDIAKPHTKKFIEGTGWTFHGHEEKGARIMKGIFYRLHLDMSKLPYIKKLIRLHLRPSALVGEGITDSAVRRLITESGEYLDDLLMLCRADITSKNQGKVNRVKRNYELVEEKIAVVRKKDELAAFQSPVRGEEIMRICGLKPSKTVGLIKGAIETAILSGEIENTYESAYAYMMKIKDLYPES